MKKKDIILLLVLLVIAAGVVVGYRFFSKPVEEDTAEVVVTVLGDEYGRYPLNKDQEVEIEATYGNSTLEIKDGHAKMLHAGCPDQICVHHPAISRDYDTIVCIPNQIIVKIEGGEEPIVDGLAQ